MKKQLIFKIFAVLAIALYQLPTMAQGIIIYHKDGTQSKYSYESIDSIVTYVKEEVEEEDPSMGETGFLYIGIKPQLGYDQGTRAINPSTYENKNNYTIEIFKDTTLVETIPGSILYKSLLLPPGEYTVKAYCGKEHAASRDEIMLYGETTCVVSAWNETHTTVTCKPTSTLMTVEFKESFKNYFYDYIISIDGIEALEGKSITWSEDDAEPWYVKVKDGGESVKCTIKAKLKEEFIEGSAYEQNENLAFTVNIKPSTAYRISISSSNNDAPSIDVAVSVGANSDTGTR